MFIRREATKNDAMYQKDCGAYMYCVDALVELLTRALTEVVYHDQMGNGEYTIDWMSTVASNIETGHLPSQDACAQRISHLQMR
jgi:hypothetical protein